MLLVLAHLNQTGCCTKIFQSVAGFAKLELCGIRFCHSLDKYVYEFLIYICEYTIT